MPDLNLGNAVGMIKSDTAPTKTYIIWAHEVNPMDPDEVVLKVYDFILMSWVALATTTDPAWAANEW